MTKNKPTQTNKPNTTRPGGKLNNSVDVRKVDPPPPKKK